MMFAFNHMIYKLSRCTVHNTKSKMNSNIAEHAEERLQRIEEETRYGYTLCCQSGYHALHAVPDNVMADDTEFGEAEIEAALRKFFEVESFYEREVYFNVLPEEWERLERKIKNSSILA